MRAFLVLTVICLLVPSFVLADEELSLDNVKAPTGNVADEPLAEEYSFDRAVHFLDQASLDWTKNRKCFTCHTNFAQLMVRPAISAKPKAYSEVRESLEQMVDKRWEKHGPRWDAEVVMSAAVLALTDAATTREMHPMTRKALDRMWTVQRDDGGFDWLKCNWPPFESDDHYGATMAAIAVGAATDEYQTTDSAKAGLAKLRKYFKANAAPMLHHEGMMLWANSYVEGLLSEEQQQATIDKLLAAQKEDGGWCLATLGKWERDDQSEQDTASSDGYATGFVIYALRRAGLSADDERLQRGITWLKRNQRASGRWYTRSLNKDSKHFISHAGSAFAVLALASCDETVGAE